MQNSSTAPDSDCLTPAGLTSKGFLEKSGLRIKPPGSPAVARRAAQRSAGLTGGTRDSPSWVSPGALGSSPTLSPREPRRLLRLPPPNCSQACALAEPRRQPPAYHPQPADCAWAAFPWTRVGEGEVAAGGGHRLGTGEVFSESESSVVVGSPYCS